MGARYGVTVVNPTGALDGPRFVATCAWPDCGWTDGPHPVKAAADEQARWHRFTHRRAGGAR